MFNFLMLISLLSHFDQSSLIGRKLPPYTMQVIYGEERGKLHCYVCEHADKEGLILFGKSAQPITAIWKDLQPEVKSRPNFKSWVTIFKTDGDKDKELLSWGESSSGLLAVGRFEDEAGPPAYGFKSEDEVLVVYFREGKIVQEFRATKGKSLDAKVVLDFLKKQTSSNGK